MEVPGVIFPVHKLGWGMVLLRPNHCDGSWRRAAELSAPSAPWPALTALYLLYLANMVLCY